MVTPWLSDLSMEGYKEIAKFMEIKYTKRKK
jgi:hypothetical protein